MELRYDRISITDRDASMHVQALIEVTPPSCSPSPIETPNLPPPGGRSGGGCW